MYVRMVHDPMCYLNLDINSRCIGLILLRGMVVMELADIPAKSLLRKYRYAIVVCLKLPISGYLLGIGT